MKTKADVEQLLIDLWGKLEPYYDSFHSRILPEGAGAAYSDEVAGMECFSRVLWGAAPLLAHQKKPELWPRHLQGIMNGTNPNHQGYWGDIHDYDQRIVEMAAFGYALCIAPDEIWHVLGEKEQQNLVNWLSQINRFKAHDCNWLFFAVIVNIGLKQVGAPYSKEKIEQNLTRIEDFYIGNGWYQDGEIAHIDYYTPFAMHYYGLFYAKVMEKDDPIRAKKYKERAVLFAKKFIYWFSEDGRSLPYGRSLTYRFAQASFWSAIVYADVEVFSLGIIKGIILRHLRHWMNQDIFLPDGTLSVGYHYPNLLMAENYNAPGSPYWSFKIFLILALPDHHYFWRVAEEPLPTLPERDIQNEPGFILDREKNSKHVVAFQTGYAHSNAHTHTSAKYEKFAYSTHFGFSVPRAEWGLDQGAFDSMLALSEQDELYRVKRNVVEKEVKETHLYMKWRPWKDVMVQTWILPGLPWHVRVHQIKTERPLDIADGGFALGIDHTSEEQLVKEGVGIGMVNDNGMVGCIDLMDEHKAILIRPNANTNLLYKRTVIPTITSSIQEGEHLLIHAFYGQPSTNELSEWQKRPYKKGDSIYSSGKKKIFDIVKSRG